MKIAVTSTGKTLESEVDPRFGRAAYIIVVDTDTKEFEVIDNNENKNAFKGAGIQAAAAISQKGAEALITGYCGPNAFTALNAGGIRVANDGKGTINDVIEQFRAGNIIYAEDANAEGHW